MKNEKDIALERLRHIILSDDEKRLNELRHEIHSLQEQIADKEALINTIDPVIADVLDRKIANSKDDFIEIMAPVIGGSIKKQVTEAKDDIVDALYPVIGKTIRKSVSEAMKNLVNSVNERIEKSLRSLNIFRMIKSKVTGVSGGELVLSESMPFYVEELFVIQKDSGLLMAHASVNKEDSTVDQELISGMLTAIRSFVASAFRKSPDQDLHEIEYGDYNIRLQMYNTFYVAAVIQGVEPNSFAERLDRLGSRIHNRFHKAIREFDGDTTNLSGCVPLLESFIEQYTAVPQQEKKRSRPYVLYALLVLGLAALAYAGIEIVWPYYQNQQRAQQVRASLLAFPELENEAIECQVQDQQLTLTGSVSSIQKRQFADSVARTMPEMVSVRNQLQIIKPATELVRDVEAALAPYTSLENVDIRFIVDRDQVLLEGYVPELQLKRDIGQLVSELEGVRTVINSISTVPPNEAEEMQSLLENSTIYFDLNQVGLKEEHVRSLLYLSAKMKFREDTLVVQGYSDNLSSPRYNLNLSQNRALAIRDYLAARSIPPDRLKVEYYGEENPKASNATEQGRAQNRRVEFALAGR